MIKARQQIEAVEDSRRCWDCDGKRQVRFVNGGPWGNEAGWMKCPTCKGTGWAISKPKPDPPAEEEA